MGAACMVAFLNGGALTSSIYDQQFGRRNELLTSFGPAAVFSELGTLRCVPALALIEMRRRFFGFRKIVEISIQSSR